MIRNAAAPFIYRVCAILASFKAQIAPIWPDIIGILSHQAGLPLQNKAFGPAPARPQPGRRTAI
jgi:hypothetical protein